MQFLCKGQDPIVTLKAVVCILGHFWVRHSSQRVRPKAATLLAAGQPLFDANISIFSKCATLIRFLEPKCNVVGNMHAWHCRHR